ncbi:MAG: hypothetical protein ACSLE1_15775 [Sphingobium sp.]
MRFSGGGGAGGKIKAITRTLNAGASSGVIATLSVSSLVAPVTYSKASGHANLTVASNGALSATNGISVGSPQTATITATAADGCTVPIALTVSGTVANAFAYAPVFILMGDSQALGTTAAGEQTTAIASYTVSDKVKVWNTAGQWVTYTPGTISGISFSVNTGNIGAELQFIKRFRADYPNDTLYLIKDVASGSFQSRGVTSSNVTASITGNIMTPTVGSNGIGTILDGTGVAKGTYTLFSAGGATSYVGTVGVGGLGYTGGNVASTVMAKYNGYLSWSVSDGLLWQGDSGQINNQSRARWAAALAALTSASLYPRVVGMCHFLGTNDMSNASSGGRFASDLADFDTRINADIPLLSTAKIVMPRVASGGIASGTVRTAQAAKSAASSQWYMVDTDSYTRHDGTHFNLAGLNGIGDSIFDVVFNSAPGI